MAFLEIIGLGMNSTKKQRSESNLKRGVTKNLGKAKKKTKKY
jgi:hypothetical protein